MGRLKTFYSKMKDGTLKRRIEEALWIYAYARSHWKGMIFYTIVGFSTTLVSLGASMVSKDLIDIITGHETGEVAKYFCITIGLAIGNLLFAQLTGFLSMFISMKVNNEIRAEIFDKILITDWESITKYHSGDLVVRWSTDSSNIADGVLNFIPNMVIYIFRFISALGVVLYYDPTFAIFALLGFPVSLIMSRTLMQRMRSNNDRSAAMNAKLSGFNQETFVNIQTIKAFDLIGLYGKYLRQLQKEFVDMKIDFQKLSIVTSLIMSLVGMVVTYSCYGWGIYRVWSGVISYGTMTMFLTLSGTLTGALNSLISLVPMSISLTTSARRLMDIIEMPREDLSRREEAKAFEERHRGEGISVSFKDLSYAYHTGTKVFEHSDFEAHPHEIVALVGPSGEGKTTMLRLILALLRPQGGEGLLTGGKETMPIAPYSRGVFAYVPQGNTMFSGTIRENLTRVRADATEEEIKEALENACAWDFVSKLSDGIDTKLMERGGGLSEGQAQRLSIARALLRRAPILLLDEATSALDVETEREVLRRIMHDTYPRTCIVTTHRPTVLSMCDRVYGIRDLKCEVLTDEEIRERMESF